MNEKTEVIGRQKLEVNALVLIFADVSSVLKKLHSQGYKYPASYGDFLAMLDCLNNSVICANAIDVNDATIKLREAIAENIMLAIKQWSLVVKQAIREYYGEILMESVQMVDSERMSQDDFTVLAMTETGACSISQFCLRSGIILRNVLDCLAAERRYNGNLRVLFEKTKDKVTACLDEFI